MFIRRDRRAPDRWLLLKLAAFGLGAAFALLGLALDSDLLVGIAIVVLFLGILLRVLGRRETPGT